MNGFKKIAEAEKLYSDFLKTASQEDLELVTKKALERLDKIKNILLENPKLKSLDDVRILSFTKTPNKDNLN